MKNLENEKMSSTERIRRMMEEFQIPSGDALVSCLLSSRNGEKVVTDAEILISTSQSEEFYADIFHFWVRAFFCFVEDSSLGSLFNDMTAHISPKKISVEEFSKGYHNLLDSHIKDEYFLECQAYPQSYIEIKGRTFSDAYIILDRPNIKSAVASSDGEYVAYFQTMPKGHN